MGTKNNKGLIILIVILGLLVIIFGGYFVYDKFIAKEEVKDVNKDNSLNSSSKSSYEKFLAEGISKRVDTVIEKRDYSIDDRYEISLTKTGDVTAYAICSNLDREKVVDQVIETKVVKSFIVDIGMTDVGDSRELVFIKEDGTVTSISLGDLLLGCEVKINGNYQLKNIIDVYDKVTIPATEYEPPCYNAFAKDIDGKETDITNLIESGRK